MSFFLSGEGAKLRMSILWNKFIIMSDSVTKMPRCLYHAAVADFLQTGNDEVLGRLYGAYHGVGLTTTTEAWEGEIGLLKRVLEPWKADDAHIIFEYDIPRLGKRIDVVVLLRGIVFCLEFKVGQREALQMDVEQVLDYALDLKNFHLYSAQRPIAPILIPTKYPGPLPVLQPSAYDDGIVNPVIASAATLQEAIARIVASAACPYDPEQWGENWIVSPYVPTPTIVEAARTLYENHSVEDITRHEADDASTDATTSYLLSVIEKSRQRGQKSICFVTGVPGAGKTLVGLDVAIKQTYMNGERNKDNGAVYLSGNGPLVAVLTEALARDNQKKCRLRGEHKKVSDSHREVSEFIQIIHRYRDNMLAKIKNPVENGRLEIDPQKARKYKDAGYGEVEHVAIFDEAQRTWTHKRLADYLKRGGTYGNKLKVPNFPLSEAAFLIWSLDQRTDWAVIVCLVGGGQEINTGEAGIADWIEALNTQFPHWHIYISSQLTEPEYAEGRVNELLHGNDRVTYSDCLHLSVSLRSFRAEAVSGFVHSLLSFDHSATALYRDIQKRGYPILLTRNIDTARTWLRKKARGTQQTGILVTKVAARYKPQAVNVLAKRDEDAVHWFLEDKTDVRSSNYLEEAATEIQVQGLELDYVCVLWDADMRYRHHRWAYYKFNNKTKWIPEHNIENQKYMLNAYRVLLTRARQGMIICVPHGNGRRGAEGFPEDPTRLPEFYDSTYQYFKNIGIEEI